MGLWRAFHSKQKAVEVQEFNQRNGEGTGAVLETGEKVNLEVVSPSRKQQC